MACIGAILKTYELVIGPDLPDDFKYGVSVYESSPEIRNAFIRKVYSILFVQLLGKLRPAGFGLLSNMYGLQAQWPLVLTCSRRMPQNGSNRSQ